MAAPSATRAQRPWSPPAAGNVLSHNGGVMVAAGGGNILSHNGGVMVAAGGGNIKSENGCSDGCCRWWEHGRSRRR